MKTLLFGAGGQLGRAFLAGDRSGRITGLARRQVDITDEQAVFEAVAACRPALIINCAAENRVDEAESDVRAARAVNTRGPGIIAGAAEKAGALLVHFGTDYVFDGEKEDYYVETDCPAPLNRYGKSKLDGERAASARCGRLLILRVSWVYGEGGDNFPARLLEWSAGGRKIRAACDQVSSPTWTETIVRFTMAAVKKDLRGLYHLAGAGYASRYELARAFFRQLGRENIVIPVPAAFFAPAAPRPHFSAMSSAHLGRAVGMRPPPWEESLAAFAGRIGRRAAGPGK